MNLIQVSNASDFANVIVSAPSRAFKVSRELVEVLLNQDFPVYSAEPNVCDGKLSNRFRFGQTLLNVAPDLRGLTACSE